MKLHLMKSNKTNASNLRSIQSTILSAVAELDLRGTDTQVTKAMCIVHAIFDAAISGKSLSPHEALKLGLALASRKP
jgi:hypothetical protein